MTDCPMPGERQRKFIHVKACRKGSFTCRMASCALNWDISLTSLEVSLFELRNLHPLSAPNLHTYRGRDLGHFAISSGLRKVPEVFPLPIANRQPLPDSKASTLPLVPHRSCGMYNATCKKRSFY